MAMANRMPRKIVRKRALANQSSRRNRYIASTSAAVRTMSRLRHPTLRAWRTSGRPSSLGGSSPRRCGRVAFPGGSPVKSRSVSRAGSEVWSVMLGCGS
jgi:hypothetical protein